MNIIEIICIGLGVMGVILALLPGPENEDRLFKFFIFAIVVSVYMCFGDLISKAWN